MWKNSNELLYYAFRQVQGAILMEVPKVTILLEEKFSGGNQEVREYCEKLKVKDSTTKLRERFTKYEIKSAVDHKEKPTSIITFEKGTCYGYYAGPLIWTITLNKKD